MFIILFDTEIWYEWPKTILSEDLTDSVGQPEA